MQNFPPDVLRSVRVQLEEEKKRVAARIGELSSQDPYTNPDRLNDNAASDTEASEESTHERFAAMIGEMKMRLADLDEALVRIGQGTYGFCSVCGEMIDTDRLAILPTATLCLTHEKKKTQAK